MHYFLSEMEMILFVIMLSFTCLDFGIKAGRRDEDMGKFRAFFFDE